MNENFEFYSVSYQNDALHSYMVFKLKPEDELIEYQIKIIRDNPIENLLALHRKQLDNEIFIHYDITSKITLEQFLARRKLSRYEFLTIIKSLVKGLQAGKRYLLHSGKYILDTRYIYINPLTLEVSLAYLPVDIQADIKEDLKTFLIDLIAYRAGFSNVEEGSFAYRLLNLLKSEAFSLEQLDKLTFNIAVEHAETKNDTINKSLVKGSAVIEGCGSLSGKDGQKELVKQNTKTASFKNKIYIGILIQILLLALAVLIIRLLAKQNYGADIYSITGAMLLLLSADFLAVNKLGILSKREATSSKPGEVAVAKIMINPEKKNNRKNKSQIKHPVSLENSKPDIFINMETTVLSEQAAPYAYLINCQDNIHEKIILSKASFIIGRVKSQVDYVSQNNAVGKVHAEIIYKDGVYYIKDLNSKNGTYINGERIVSNVEYVVKNNDSIAFANSEYKFLWIGGESRQLDHSAELEFKRT